LREKGGEFCHCGLDPQSPDNRLFPIATNFAHTQKGTVSGRSGRDTADQADQRGFKNFIRINLPHP